MTCGEAQELITALVDGELPEPERASLEIHLHACADCQTTLAEERTLKQAVRESGAQLRAPAALRARILSDPRIFPAQRRGARRWRDYLWPMPPALRPALAVAILLAVALPAYYFMDHREEPVAVTALETYDLFLRGKLAVPPAATAEEIAAQLTRAVGGRFHPMGYDFSAMDLRPVAGLVREIDGRKILVAIYQGPQGAILCYTFLGSEDDAPPNAAKFFDAGKQMNFYAFSHGRVNAVLHREGDVICILASEIPMEELLAVTRSKARPS
jgi:mycothiol system anti-sigma-R factor